jgi:hypothetical protein
LAHKLICVSCVRDAALLCCVVEQDTGGKLAAVVQFAVSMSPQDMRTQVCSHMIASWDNIFYRGTVFVCAVPSAHSVCVILC